MKFKEVIKSKKFIISSVVGVLVVLISFFSYIGYSKKTAQTEMLLLETNILSMNIKSDALYSKYSSIWRTSINNGGIVYVDNERYSDFDTALEAQYKSFIKNGDIKELEDQYNKTKNLYTKLNKKFVIRSDEKFKAIKKYYIASADLKSFAKYPTGSYKTYTSLHSDKEASIDTAKSNLDAV